VAWLQPYPGVLLDGLADNRQVSVLTGFRA
jgi:hypothetical protein